MKTNATSTGASLRQLAEREERVFPTYPQVARYFPAASTEDARHRLGRAIERGDGPGLVIGGPGTGKSLLLQVLASQYHERFDVVLPACARLCTRRALLQAILFELGLPYRVRDEGDLRLSLLDHLLSREECPTGLLLLVDEAQTLSTSLLDELRVLTNLVRGGMPRVRLVLAGSSALEECFAHPELESFSQRLSARCYLGPFGREETSQFVRAQLAASSGAPDELFSQDAWDAIFEATDGVPRLINQVCDRALMEGAATNRPRIDRAIIQAIWADIQQLPAPWDTPAPTTAPPVPLQVVEFGQLDEAFAQHNVVVDELIVERTEDDDFAEIEATELDAPEAEAVASIPKAPAPVAKATTSNIQVSAATTADPFAEEFDEEEVVIDSFASWDEMFHRDVPRVTNRRDPSFSALVQAAITTEDFSKNSQAHAATQSPRARVADVDDSDVAMVEPVDIDLLTNGGNDWPPLRLAIISDSATPPAELEGQSIGESPFSAAWNVPQADHLISSTWSRHDASHEVELVGQSPAFDEEPVLIVEDDNPAPKAPVRREEYRNLFSRLRSG